MFQQQSKFLSGLIENFIKERVQKFPLSYYIVTMNEGQSHYTRNRAEVFNSVYHHANYENFLLQSEKQELFPLIMNIFSLNSFSLVYTTSYFIIIRIEVCKKWT